MKLEEKGGLAPLPLGAGGRYEVQYGTVQAQVAGGRCRAGQVRCVNTQEHPRAPPKHQVPRPSRAKAEMAISRKRPSVSPSASRTQGNSLSGALLLFSSLTRLSLVAMCARFTSVEAPLSSRLLQVFLLSTVKRGGYSLCLKCLHTIAMTLSMG